MRGRAAHRDGSGARAHRAEPGRSGLREERSVRPAAGAFLAPHQPAQQYLVVDLQRLREDDLPLRNLVGAVSRMECSRSVEELRRVAASLQEWLREPKDMELRRAFADWLWRLARRLQPDAAAADSPPPGLNLEDVRMTLEEMSLEERVALWPKPWLEKDLEQGPEKDFRDGLRKGLREGVEHERALLRRQVAVRFGADVAERASEVLERIVAPESFVEIGELIVRCETGREFLARMGA